jgi:hypothetical protein
MTVQAGRRRNRLPRDPDRTLKGSLRIVSRVMHLCVAVHPSVYQVAHMELLLCRGI